jgi:hypothetical protein
VRLSLIQDINSDRDLLSQNYRDFYGVQPIQRRPFWRKPIRRKTDSAKAFLAKGVSAKILKCYLHVIHEFHIK